MHPGLLRHEEEAVPDISGADRGIRSPLLVFYADRPEITVEDITDIAHECLSAVAKPRQCLEVVSQSLRLPDERGNGEGVELDRVELFMRRAATILPAGAALAVVLFNPETDRTVLVL